jgi:hypothetical protein
MIGRRREASFILSPWPLAALACFLRVEILAYFPYFDRRAHGTVPTKLLNHGNDARDRPPAPGSTQCETPNRNRQQTSNEATMKFGLCYIPDYHAEHSGSWTDWYEGMIAEVRLAEVLGFDSAWFAEHRVPGFAFGSPASPRSPSR